MTDLSLWVRLAGYGIRFAPDSLVLHRYRLRFGANKVFLPERKRHVVLFRSYHWFTLLTHLPALVLAEVVMWSFVLGRERAQIGGKAWTYLSIAKTAVLTRGPTSPSNMQAA